MLILGSVLGAACGDEPKDQVDPSCDPSAPPEVPTEVDGAVRGSVTVLDRRDNTLDDSGNPRADVQGRITATFADFSAVTSTPSALMLLGDTCVGIVSRPQSSGDIVRLDLDSLEVKGTAGGDVRPMRTMAGVYASVRPSRLLDGAATIQVVGTAAVNGFPAFDQTLDGIDTLEVSEPLSDGSALLTAGELFIRWNAGDGDYVQITATPNGDPGQGGQVACLVRDDGCFVFPANASGFLLASRTDDYTLSVERHRYRSVRLGENTTLDVDVISDHRLSLKNGVLE